MTEVIRLVFGFGINDADYRVSYKENGELYVCPFYKVWASMLERVFWEIPQKKFVSYKNCTVHSDWVYFTAFRNWMEQQDWQGNELDKDLLVKGNREYGPSTCLFIPKKVNMFIVGKEALQRDLPTGVNYNATTKRFRAKACDLNGVQRHIGCYDTVEEASNAYIDFKIKVAAELAELQTDPKIKTALLNYYAR